uniref:Uncharacterized protein n=1 Tax=Romanomermis culicivorax TaxID=13658 RepID=A0A915K6J0_ROMCU
MMKRKSRLKNVKKCKPSKLLGTVAMRILIFTRKECCHDTQHLFDLCTYLISQLLLAVHGVDGRVAKFLVIISFVTAKWQQRKTKTKGSFILAFSDGTRRNIIDMT